MPRSLKCVAIGNISCSLTPFLTTIFTLIWNPNSFANSMFFSTICGWFLFRSFPQTQMDQVHPNSNSIFVAQHHKVVRHISQVIPHSLLSQYLQCRLYYLNVRLNQAYFLEVTAHHQSCVTF